MRHEIPRVYADTSVFGGVYDEAWSPGSTAFFDQVRCGRFELVSSALVMEELVAAPAFVRKFAEDVLAMAMNVEVSREALRLRNAYVDAGIVNVQHRADALHVALATLAGCDAIVSWNFRHLVHFDKIPLYNAVNTLQGYSPLAICSPLEVIEYAEEDI